MRYGIFFLALGLVWSSQVSAQSVYVALGGVYIASANVHVGAGNGYPTYGAPGAAYYGPYDTAPAYAPGYVPPGPIYRAPAFYEGDGYGSVYSTRPAKSVLYVCGGTSAAAARPCALQQPGALWLQSSLWSVGIL
jgi:hypothetical protein